MAQGSRDFACHAMIHAGCEEGEDNPHATKRNRREEYGPIRVRTGMLVRGGANRQDVGSDPIHSRECCRRADAQS